MKISGWSQAREDRVKLLIAKYLEDLCLDHVQVNEGGCVLQRIVDQAEGGHRFTEEVMVQSKDEVGPEESGRSLQGVCAVSDSE